MPIILQIETSSTNTSVVLAKDGKVIASKEQDSAGYSHEKLLHPFVEQVLQEAKLNMTDLDAIAVGSGPGSFTGLRIGVAGAKGLCFALDIPLISVPTMELLARQITTETELDRIIAVVDARRMEVYTTVFTADYQELVPTHAYILEEDAYAELEGKKLAFVGSGAKKIQEFKEFQNAIFLSDALPSAKEMTIPALKRYKAQEFEDTAYFEPFYLKDFKPH
ncbi:MAG TPA: tRNA (adenosine(37)-N6)-threonylcarbamoyltransferase complex dimerization subunit type 1 TsaB [Flavobacteriaceae bacterium]|nr:tRNA (adenosine(37)-N6)-threonylcarbamoyltransferase complex dimerization subunit type 1 TsaB [Flavobacteriaceae bacterium]